MQANLNKLERKLAQANEVIKPLKIEVDKGTRLRIRVRRKDINFTKATFDYSESGINATVAICQEILADYYRGQFDSTLVKYGLNKPTTPKLTEVVALPVSENSEPNLLEIWDMYKQAKPNTPNSTKQIWKDIDSWLSNCPSECLLPSNADKLLAWLRTRFSDTTLLPKFKLLSAAINLAIKLGKPIQSNPFPDLKKLLELPSSKEIKAYSKDEIKIIIQSFKDARFDAPHTALKNDFYAPLVEFRFLTGCRPSEAIALTWDDIKWTGDKCQIVFNKRYTYGQLLFGTKNGIKARIFPCNEQLKEFIRNLPKITNGNNLVFPARRGGYMNTNNLSGRIWNKYINKLVELGAIKEYLPFYDERHTYITHVTRIGLDIKTTSAISGNSPKTIMNHYLATNTDIELPEI